MEMLSSFILLSPPSGHISLQQLMIWNSFEDTRALHKVTKCILLQGAGRPASRMAGRLAGRLAGWRAGCRQAWSESTMSIAYLSSALSSRPDPLSL